jgi:hypothetical protein
MSLDMLVNGAKVASRDVVASSRIIPLQLDFSSPAELVTVQQIRNNVLMHKPVLFSLLGNTLANFEDDVATLATLVELLGDDDLLALELATTRTVDAANATQASLEYSNIPSFESFVRSALTQHTDLPRNRIEYLGEICHDGQALQIDMNYVSAAKCRGRLIDGSTIELRPQEKIRLYRSRKYTYAAIQAILGHVGLVETAYTQWSELDSPFGLYLGLCKKRATARAV